MLSLTKTSLGSKRTHFTHTTLTFVRTINLKYTETFIRQQTMFCNNLDSSSPEPKLNTPSSAPDGPPSLKRTNSSPRPPTPHPVLRVACNTLDKEKPRPSSTPLSDLDNVEDTDEKKPPPRPPTPNPDPYHFDDSESSRSGKKPPPRPPTPVPDPDGFEDPEISRDGKKPPPRPPTPVPDPDGFETETLSKPDPKPDSPKPNGPPSPKPPTKPPPRPQTPHPFLPFFSIPDSPQPGPDSPGPTQPPTPRPDPENPPPRPATPGSWAYDNGSLRGFTQLIGCDRCSVKFYGGLVACQIVY